MEYRRLGNSGLFVSVFSFGTMTFGGRGNSFAAVGTTQATDATRLVDICLEAGVNLFDTADIYSAGGSEEILGEAVSGRRHDLLIATKAFAEMKPGPNGLGLSRGHLIEACEASLSRLKTDYIDLYQVHNFDSFTPLEETLRALDDLVRSGKVRYIGLSSFSGWHVMKAAAVAQRINVNQWIGQQIQYSLINRDAENELLPVGTDQGLGALVWSPLAGGYLSGKFRLASARGRVATTGRLTELDDQRSRRIVEKLQEIAASYPGASPSQAALNWLRRKAGISSIILGARNETQLRENLAAASWSMRDEHVEQLDECSAARIPYPQSHQRAFSRRRNPLAGPVPVSEA